MPRATCPPSASLRSPPCATTHFILSAAYAAAASSPIVVQTTAFLFSGSLHANEFALAYEFCVSDCSDSRLSTWFGSFRKMTKCHHSVLATDLALTLVRREGGVGLDVILRADRWRIGLFRRECLLRPGVARRPDWRRISLLGGERLISPGVAQRADWRRVRLFGRERLFWLDGIRRHNRCRIRLRHCNGREQGKQQAAENNVRSAAIASIHSCIPPLTSGSCK